jgi:hypothetical protein
MPLSAPKTPPNSPLSAASSMIPAMVEFCNLQIIPYRAHKQAGLRPLAVWNTALCKIKSRTAQSAPSALSSLEMQRRLNNPAFVFNLR